MNNNDLKQQAKQALMEVAKARRECGQCLVISFILLGVCALSILGLCIAPDLLLTKIIIIGGSAVFGLIQIRDMLVLRRKRQAAVRAEMEIRAQVPDVDK